MTAKSEFVRLTEVTKEFSGVKALSGVTLSAFSGEVLALLGENGAGKSTLMNILSGVYPDGTHGGEIFLKGERVRFHSPADAEHAGITIIHQELSTFPHLTVAENMWVGHWPTRRGLVDWKEMRENARQWLSAVGASIDPEMTMGDLSTGSQQLVEIAKALSRRSQLLIFDEPTSSLTPNEVEQLFNVIRRLRTEGKAIIYISHKMEEIFALADRITVLRDGKSVGSCLISETDEKNLISLMVGRSLDRLFPPRNESSPAKGDSVLKVRDFQARQIDGKKHIGPISFDLRRGEILGFAGLLGSGRTELVQALLGANDRFQASGSIEIKGHVYQGPSPRDAIRARIGYVGEDRKRDSIFAVRSLSENISISRLSSGFLGRVINSNREWDETEGSLKHLRTRFRDQTQEIRELSGGNQQKVVIGRILQTAPDIIILDEPTRGVDVGAKYEIYQILFDLAQAGRALIVISSDLPELMALSDRIIVLREGEFMGELERTKFSQQEIMRLAVSTTKVNA